MKFRSDRIRKTPAAPTDPAAPGPAAAPELGLANEALDSGDIPAALRRLRPVADSLPPAGLAGVLERAATMAGFDDLRQASAQLAAEPGSPKALYDFGYACIERGIAYLAVPALREALRLLPESAGVLRELVAAYEREDRNREAADVLAAREASLTDWPDRYLLVFNAVMAGDLPLTRSQFARLSTPEDEMWLPVHARISRTVERAASAGTAAPLDRTDLRGWQFVIGGSLLGTLSPFGFEAGMHGRYAWLQDSYSLCLRGLLRLRSALAAAGARPESVSLLPDRDSLILGLAAAEVLGLPAKPFAPGRGNTVVVAYRLDALDDTGAIAAQLVERAPGQVLHEHASCWTEAPPVTADSIALLHQTAVAPWGAQQRYDRSGRAEGLDADDRPAEALAAAVVQADPSADPGDGGTPADSDEAFAAFAAAVGPTWLLGSRDRLRSPGPVPSSRFR